MYLMPGLKICALTYPMPTQIAPGIDPVQLMRLVAEMPEAMPEMCVVAGVCLCLFSHRKIRAVAMALIFLGMSLAVVPMLNRIIAVFADCGNQEAVVTMEPMLNIIAWLTMAVCLSGLLFSLYELVRWGAGRVADSSRVH